MGAPLPRPIAPAAAALALAAALLAAARAPAAPPVSRLLHTPSGLPIVTARIGTGVARLLLDTGDTGGLSLDDRAAARLGLVVAGRTGRKGRALLGRGVVARGVARVDRLSLGGRVWRGLDATVVPAAALFRESLREAVDGAAGLGLFAGGTIVLDDASGTFALAAEGDSDAMPDGGAPLRLSGGRLITEVSLDGEPAAALIDTGSAVTLVDASLAAGSPEEPGPPRPIVDASGAARVLVPRRLASLLVGGTTLRGVPAVPLDLAARLAPPADHPGPRIGLVIGADLFAGRRVTLDASRGRFRIEAPR